MAIKPISVSAADAQDILGRLHTEYDAGLNHRRPKLKQWQRNDDRVNGNVKAPRRSMNNFHIPILAGYEDTLLAKIDDQPQLKFGSDQPGEKRLGRKYDELYRQVSTRPGREWKMADLSAKRDAARYGRALLELAGTSQPFSIEMSSVDPYSFYCDPLCGDRLSKARFIGRDDVFRSLKELEDGVKEGLYDEVSVAAIRTEPDDVGVSLTEAMTESLSRFASLHLDGWGYSGVGDKVYHLNVSGTTYRGIRYYCVWSPEANVLFRCQKLSDVYGIPDGHQLWHVVSWAPNPDKKVFWSKAPEDDVSDVAEFSRQTMMYAADGLLKGVWGSRAYDPAKFDASDLVFQPDGLVPSKKNASDTGSGLSGAIHQFTAPDYNGAFNLLTNLDAFVGQKSGVTPDTQGVSDTDTLGIARQNIEQVSDRMGLTSKHYQSCYNEVGQLFLFMAKRLLKGKQAVKLIGAEGYEFESLVSREIDPSISITVRGGRAEESMSQVKREAKVKALADIAANPQLPKWLVEERLRLAGYEDSEVKAMTDESRYGSSDQVNRANEAVEMLLEGKRADIYQGADDSFVKTILDSARRYTDSDGPEYDRLIAYARAHVGIVGQNKAEQAMRETVELEQSIPQEEIEEMPVEQQAEPLTGQPQFVPPTNPMIQ